MAATTRRLLMSAMAVIAASTLVSQTATAQGASGGSRIQALFAADSVDRVPPPGGRRRTAEEWRQVGERDLARLAETRTLYRQGALTAPRELFQAAAIFQHSIDRANEISDLLTAHELAIVAALEGVTEARYLVAASEDRLLRALQRPQRFGTQWEPDSAGRFAIAPTDSLVRDWFRRRLEVPDLARLIQRPGDR